MNVTELFEELDKYFEREAVTLNDPSNQQKIVTYLSNEGVRVSIDNEVHNCIFQVCCLILEDELWLYFVQRTARIKILFDNQDISFSKSVTDFLTISASRPYLLENETTDLIVNLVNGFGVPLENKDILVKKILFEDIGVTGKKNNNWTNYSNRLNVTTTDDGTLLEKGSSNGYYFVNNSAFVYSNYVCEFDVVDIKGQCYWYHQANSSSVQDVINFSSYYVKGKHIKMVCNDGTLKVYADGNQIGSDISLTTSTPFEIGFGINTHQTDERYFKFKNFVVSNDYNLKTDSNGLATLYTIDVTENTVFRALYQNEKAECEVYPCLMIDYGVTNNKSTKWYIRSTDASSLSVTVDEGGTTLSSNDSSASRFYFANPQSTSGDSPPITIGDFVVECDVISTNFTSGSQIAFLVQGLGTSFNLFSYIAPYHLKMEKVGTTVKQYINDTLIRTTTISSRTNYYMGFQLYKPCGIKFKNYKIYSI